MFKLDFEIKNKFYFTLLTLFPIFYIVGSLFLNIIIVLISLVFIVNFLKIKYNKSLLVFFFFIIIFFIINSIFSESSSYSFYKSFAYLRYLLFVLGLFYILYNTSGKLKKTISKIFILISIFLIADIFFEFFNGSDIFGNNYGANYNRISGPFGDELIVGFFLFYFGFISWGLFIRYHNFKNKFIFYIFTVTIIYTIYLTGERNAFYSSLIFLILIIFFEAKIRKISLIALVTITVLFYFSNKFNVVGNKYDLSNINQIKSLSKEKDNYDFSKFEKMSNTALNSHWILHYKSAFEIFKENPIIGSGFKTFRTVCPKNEKSKKYLCASQPHNIYFELLSDTGIIGLLIFVLIFFYPIFLFLKNFNNLNISSKIFFALFLVYIFPFKPHGSLFTTSFASLLWFLYSINLYCFEDDKKK